MFQAGQGTTLFKSRGKGLQALSRGGRKFIGWPGASSERGRKGWRRESQPQITRGLEHAVVTCTASLGGELQEGLDGEAVF